MARFIIVRVEPAGILHRRRPMARPSPLLPILLGAACIGELPETPEVFDDDQPPSACSGKCDGANDVEALGGLPQVRLATLFAPYDPTAGLDLTLIRTVVDARKADARPHYAEGENPFTIRYAVYNLDNPVIVTALADAEDGNVDVQILIE